MFPNKGPKDLQDLIKRQELRYSLKTGYVGAAKDKARFLAGQVQQVFRYLRKRRSTLRELSAEEIPALVQEYIKYLVKSFEESLHEELEIEYDSENRPAYINKPFTSQWEFRQYIDSFEESKRDLIADLNVADFGKLEPGINNLLRHNQIETPDKQSLAYIKLCAEIYRAKIKSMLIEKKILLCDDSYRQDLSRAFPEIFPPPEEPVSPSKKEDEQRSEPIKTVF